MTDLNSKYDCANASSDLPELIGQLQQLESGSHEKTPQWQDQVNHLQNQINFIRNKCDITKES